MAQNHTIKEASQRYNKGNVAVRPQDSTELRSLLPPTYDQLRDAMCVVFTGQTQRPSRETVKSMHPVLVTKSCVHLLIDFLIANNPWYQKSNVAYSQKNMDMLFDKADAELNCSVPAALDICYLPANSDVQHESNFDGLELRDIGESSSGEIVMEAVGFTQGDHSSQSREKMKLHALAHVLDQKCFLLSRTGSNYVADNDPGLMSFLFPHLDPWDIGGFNHCGHTPKQQLSMEVQVRNLLLQDDSPFRKDANFAFICWNMMQKKEISRNTSF
ncbi:hypothetical protein F4604DRAFT_1923720 [Suillus subluteus]|nr:hypothetical protein F4604DRAFT_1923720 [Suillus subluteus]